MHLAKNLRFLRRRAELSQTDLAEKIGTDYNSISRYESGKSTPKLETLTKLTQVFGVGLEELRDEDLTTVLLPAQLTKAAEQGKPTTPGRGSGAARGPKPPAPAAGPAKHPITVSIELDGTRTSFERAVARLAAINEVVANTD